MFKKILWRSVLAPIGAGVVSCLLFAGLTYYLVTAHRWVEHTENVLADAAAIQKLFVDTETSVRGFVITGSDKFLTPYSNAVGNWEPLLIELRKKVTDNPIQTQRLREIEDLFRGYQDYAKRTIEQRKTNFSKAVDLVSSEEGKNLMDQVRLIWSRFENTERDLLSERSRRSESAANLFMFLIVGGTLLVSFATAVWGRKQITDLSKSYEELALDQIRKNQILEHNQWLKHGQNQLVGLFLGKLNMDEFGERVLNFLSKALNAQAATFFTKEENGDLKRVFQSGLMEDLTQIHNRFRANEGILGAAVKNRKSITLNDLPATYFQLSSGLGSTEAKYLIVTPIYSRDELIGAFELGFISRPDEKATEFLDLVSDSLGTGIQSIQDQQKMEKLYHEVQNQAEELQAQEEELRVSNEELETQMRLLKESQQYTENQNSRLEESNYQLQSQALILEEQKNLLESRNVELQSMRSDVELKARELEQSSRYKSEFLANMSHELRTPLNSTLILAQLLIENKKGHLDDKEIEYAKHILSSGNDLLMLINDILDLSKVEAGKLDLTYEDFKVSAVLQNLKNTFLPSAEAKGIQFEAQIPTEDFSVFSDRARIEQVLKNLLSNAVKFTTKGAVRIHVERHDNMVEFVVSDTGIGIPPEHQQAIFDAFKQADGTISRKYGGTGLGLSISRSLSQLLGGTITLSSTPGEGSTFRLCIPLQQGALAATPPTPFKMTAPLSMAKPAVTQSPIKEFIRDDRERINESDEVILIVEDDIKFATVVRDLVQQRGFKCVVCETAESAMSAAKQFRLRFVLLDIQLPDHSGLIVLDQLKRHNETRYVPVQVFSAKDFMSEAFKLGAVGYTLKPIVKERLDRILLELEGKFQKPSRKVLVVEDDARQQIALRELLEDGFLKTTIVTTGQEALHQIHAGGFDCVVMDLNLPDMSGFEVLRNLMDQSDHSTPPIIVYTGKDLSSEEERELKRYSGSIIVKGARSPERLLDEVMLYLYRVDSSLPASHRRILTGVRDTDQSLEGKRILLVDDDMRNIFALASGLEQKGAVITIAKDGLEAIQTLEQSEYMDVVLMDIMMPNMDGYTAIEEIRKRKRFANLPILAVTAKAMKDDRDRALAAGADDYISKPVDMDRLISLIRVWTMRVN